MPTFPADIKILNEGYGMEQDSATKRSAQDSGAVKQIRIYNTAPVKTTIKAIASIDAFESFKTWFRKDISMGSYFFDLYDPQSNEVKKYRIYDGTYKATPIDGSDPKVWVLSMTLESFPI
jgi:hypothetical protein